MCVCVFASESYGLGRNYYLLLFLIEVLFGLYEMSLKIKKQWELSNADKFNCTLDFVHGSILEKWDWVEQSVPAIIFANSTCFNDEIFSSITENSKLLTAGSYVITLSVPIMIKKSNKIKLLKELRLDMSWGESDVFIHYIN